ncbi:MAG: serine/threonine-protein kinase [Gemmatimonadaceae bacterium]
MADLRTQLQSTLGSAYNIERELGGGGMSRVFIAEEVALGRRVVVKVLPPDVAAGVNVERFRREIQTSAKLQHPHIVPVHATGEIGDTDDGRRVPYYTMPYVEGESLRVRLGRTGALSITEAVSVLRDVGRALAYAHEHGVAHRDIKPDNILLSGGSAAVADFGIAKAISASRDEPTGTTLTQIGTSLGTPAYMAPEQAAADPSTNHRADIYAFGCVAYELLAGRPPFTERSPQRLLAAQMGEMPQPIGELRPDTPPDLAALVMKCLEKEADMRPQSAAELVRVLETVTSGGGHAALPSILFGGPGMLWRALAVYAATFVVVLIVSQVAVVAIGLPDWVVPGATVVMLMGLPVIVFTAYVQRVTRRALTRTPTYTPGGTPSMPQSTMATMAMKASPHLSWRRAALGGVYALGVFVVLVAGFMVLRALGIGPAGSLFAAGKLKENDRLVVADFDTQGSADSALGRVVAEAIRTDLEQSRAVTMMSPTAVRATLQRMQRAPGLRVSAALAREVAQREGVRAIVHGDITPLGAGFIVTARLTTADGGEELASFRETADAPKDLIPAVEKLSRSLRARMGESLRAVQATPALDQVSTGSLEALRRYTEANAISDADVPRSIALLQEAVAIDSGFAMAWRKMGVLYNNARYPRTLQDSVTSRAYRLRQRLTESERDNVEAYYYGTVLQDRVKEVQVYERVVQRVGPNDPAVNNLALRYAGRREYARAESLLRRTVSTGAGTLINYQNLALVLHHGGKRRQADSMLAVGETKFNNPALIKRVRVSLLYDAGQIDSTYRVLQGMRQARDLLERSLGWRIGANIDQTRGRLSVVAAALEQAQRADSARGADNRPLWDSVRLATIDAWFRDRPKRTVQRLDAMLDRVQLRTLDYDQRPYFPLAISYARAGRPDRAKAILAQFDAEVRDTMRKRIETNARDLALAEVALAEGRFPQALELRRRADQLPDGPGKDCAPCVDVDVARVFDMAGQRDSAIVYFERYLNAPFIFRLWGQDGTVDIWYRAATHKRLGELYEQRGEVSKALDQYERFVVLWKDADAELQPKVADVRRRLARLRASEQR